MKPTNCVHCGGRGPHEGPGHAYTPASVVADALDAWLTACEAFAEFRAHASDGTRLAAARDVLGALVAPIPHEHTRAVLAQISVVSDRFGMGQYSDDDTDAPCDVEWDVHSLLAAVDPAHVVPDEVEPSHVVGTCFPHPDDE